jgi:hypothetical protein
MTVEDVTPTSVTCVWFDAQQSIHKMELKPEMLVRPPPGRGAKPKFVPG